MKAGIYLVKDNISEKKYIVSVNGKEPFLKVSNAIELSSFANGILSKNNEFIQKILENPNNFEFNLLSKEIEQNEIPSILPRKFNISITDEQYNKIISNTENIDEAGNLKSIETISDIQATLLTSWEDSETIYHDIVVPRFENKDKWIYLKQKTSSMSEANSVLQ